MAILKSFLCLCNTRTGSLISGCYTLTISLVCLVYYLFRYVGHKLVEDSAEYKGIIYVGFVLYGFMIVSSLVIIPGVQLDKRYLLLPWIYIIILMVLYDTGSVALLTTVHMEREKTLHIWEIIWVFFYLFRLAANCYCFTCVVSQYQELSDGRGTYDFLYKPRRRARLRNGSQFDLDTYDLPFGVHLPPYVEEDQTQNNPPSYETIYPAEVQTNTNTDNQDSEYVEIEINQTPAIMNEHYPRFDNSLYPLPTDENGCHGTQESVLEQGQNIESARSIIHGDLNSDISQLQQTFDLHRRPSSCCHGDEIYHLPFCPKHNNFLRLHNHMLHNHHQQQQQQHQNHQNHDLYHYHRPRSLEGQQRSRLDLDNQAFKRDSQCYEVTVNIEWI